MARGSVTSMVQFTFGPGIADTASIPWLTRVPIRANSRGNRRWRLALKLLLFPCLLQVRQHTLGFAWLRFCFLLVGFGVILICLGRQQPDLWGWKQRGVNYQGNGNAACETLSKATVHDEFSCKPSNYEPLI